MFDVVVIDFTVLVSFRCYRIKYVQKNSLYCFSFFSLLHIECGFDEEQNEVVLVSFRCYFWQPSSINLPLPRFSFFSLLPSCWTLKWLNGSVCFSFFSLLLNPFIPLGEPPRGVLVSFRCYLGDVPPFRFPSTF